MKVVGLTGSIATGKSFVARCFAKLGFAIFDSDYEVHKLLNSGGEATKKVAKAFPESYVDNAIDRKILGEIVFEKPDMRKKLENIIYPLLAKERENFIKEHKKLGDNLVVLEIPLLFENGLEKICDHVVVTTADYYLQEKRAMQRTGMTKQKFEAINKLQMDSRDKTQKADFLIDTGFSQFVVFREIKKIVSLVVGKV